MSIRVAGTQKTLEANGASITTTSIGSADDANYSVSSDGSGYAHVEIVLACAFSVAPGENSSIDIYLRPLDVDGTNDTEAPEGSTSFKGNWYAGSVLANNVTTTQYMFLRAYDVPPNFSVYLHNNTGQTMSAGWTLKATPIAYRAA